MEALKEMGLLTLILLVVYLLANLIIRIYWKWRLRQYDKASADYQRGVEKHQLSDMRMSTYPDPPPKRKASNGSRIEVY